MSGYQRINFKDQNVERPKTYDVTNNPDGSITLIESFGNVEELGTPINQENMNHIEDGIDAVSFSKFSLDLTFKKDDLVTNIEDSNLKIYKSLQDNNFGRMLFESEYWEEIKTDRSSFDGQWTPTNIVLATFVSLSAGQTLTYSIPDTIPNDGYDYEIIGNLQARGGTGSADSAISISTAFGQFGGFRAQTGFRPASYSIGIMKSEDRRIIIQSGASWTDITVSIVAYRRLGKNQ